ncbi:MULTISPECIES: hypothetical protein [unclassified Micromonospora]|uniref:hypothetical protein n=1 Tax=unclassified Micromonospora TaxID=2617518 RepID=UPI00363A8221
MNTWKRKRLFAAGAAAALLAGTAALPSPALAEDGDGADVRVTVDIEEIREPGVLALSVAGDSVALSEDGSTLLHPGGRRRGRVHLDVDPVPVRMITRGVGPVAAGPTPHPAAEGRPMIRSVPQALPRLLAILAAVLVTVPVAPAGAGAEPAAPKLTWAVQPADPNGPDGRRWIERTLDPGQVVTEHLAVRNFSDAAAVFRLQAADGYLTDKGRFNMLPSGEASKDGGTWIAVRDTVTVAANETKVVPFTITVPGDATPGDHPAGIAASVTSTGGTVAVESRVGFRVMLRASGTATAALAVDDLTASYSHSWNPFSPGTVRIRYVVANDGNVWASGKGRVTVSELFGLAGRDTTVDVEELLPGGSRVAQARVGGVWALGPLRTTVAVTPAALGDGAVAEARQATATVTVWTVPWPQLGLVVVLAAVALAVRTVRRRRRRRLALLLDRARQEGRASATTAGASTS